MAATYTSCWQKEMMLPPAGKGLSAKQPALSLTQSREPNLQIKPEATRSPVAVARPVRKRTPSGDAEGPTVGANYRGIVTADVQINGLSREAAHLCSSLRGVERNRETRCKTRI